MKSITLTLGNNLIHISGKIYIFKLYSDDVKASREGLAGPDGPPLLLINVSVAML